MGRLSDYLLIEKVSKKEISDALNNPNVLIGAEWEFYYVPFEEMYNEKQEEINDYLREFEYYEKDMELYREKMEEYEEAMSDYYREFDDWEKRVEYNKKQMKLSQEEEEYVPDPPEEPIEPEEPEEPYRPDGITGNMIYNECYDVDEEELIDFFIDDIPKDIRNITSDWDISHDQSLDLERGGIEIASEPESLKDFLKNCPKIFDYINKEGYTDTGCGFHVSISLKNIKSLNKELDVVKLALFTEEEYIYKFFDSRKCNKYAKSVHDAVMSGNIDSTTLKKLIDTKKLKDKYEKTHFMAINIEHLDTDNEYIEFRYLGGKDYEKRWDKIRTIIAHYIYNLSLACDPDYKRKEYIKKIQRILNKIELYKLECLFRLKMTSPKDIKRIKPSYDILRKRVKLTNKERDILSKTVEGKFEWWF